jgi:uncharacterized protein with HEPN domain
MQPRTLGCLLDIKGACEEILAFVGGNPDVILSDRLTALAVERLLLVVGEALVRIRGLEASVLDSIPDWEAVIGMRNAIVHGYDVIDAARVRDAIRDDIPLLLSAVIRLLPREGQP